MNMFTIRMHPTFDALSALADLDELDRARTRVGRHAATCAECRAVMAEIRALGDGARAIELEGAPEHLWERIAMGQGRGDTQLHPASIASVPSLQNHVDDAPLLERSPGITEHVGGRSRSRMWAISAIAAVLLAAVVLWPSADALNASGTSRLTFSPGRPVPGGTLNVRYTPAPYLKGASRLVLIGWFAERPGTPKAVLHGPAFDVDSLASLVLTADGSYHAKLALPDDFRSVHLAVVDSTGERMDRDGERMWIAIGGNIDRSPSLASLLSAEDNRRWIGSFNNGLLTGPTVSVADSIQRYFPDHPAGWALYKGYGVRKGVFDVLHFFESAERKYASIDERLWRRRQIDAEQMHTMVGFAMRISEPTEAAKWATRLLREHPTSPYAFADVGSAIHQMEINSAAGVADSVRAWLPLLISSRAESDTTIERYSMIARLVHSYGDSADRVRWPLREPYHDFVSPGSAQRGPDAAREQRMRTMLTASCTRPAGRFSVTEGAPRVEDWCRLSRFSAFGTVARAELRRGNHREAVRLADSALATAPAAVCVAGAAHRVRAEARIALADTVGAVRDLAVVAASSRQFAGVPDSLRGVSERLGKLAVFNAVVDSARVPITTCDTRQRSAMRARPGSFAQGLY